MDKIFIKDLLVRGVIGITDRERRLPQDIIINIILYTDIRKASLSDNIADCVNYSTVTKKVMAYAESINRYTVEALTSDIASLCLQEEGVLKVCVRVEKPGAVRFSRSVGIEIERERDN
jgi:FolB domain-containing protein